MTAYAAARLQYVDSRVLVGKFYQFPYVDFCFVADHRQLIGKSYLRIAGRIFGEFAHFGCPGVGAMECALYECRIKLYGFFRRFGIDTAYDPVIVYQLVEGVARQYPLGTVSYEYFVSQLGALAIYQFGHAFGREDRRGRFYDEEVSLFQKWDNRASCRLDVCGIGTVVLFERSGNDNEECVGCFGFGYGT